SGKKMKRAAKKSPNEKAQQNAIALMEEIAANFSWRVCTLPGQRLAAAGHVCLLRQDLFNKLLAYPRHCQSGKKMKRAAKKSPNEKAQQNAIALMEEIAANFS
ncbi:hypothetical protein C2U36_26635, partial [Escherichia coli]